MLIIAVAVIVLVVIAYGFFKNRKSQKLENMLFPGRLKGRKPGRKEKELERTLLRLVHGRTEVAQRLIELEQSRHPDKSREWCLQKAVDAIRRDRR